MAVIITLSPVLTFSFVMALRMEVFDVRRAAGILLGLVGAALLVLPHGSLPTPEMLPFAVQAMATPILFAVGNAYAERYRPADADSMALAVGLLFFAAIAMALVGLAIGEFHPIWAEFAVRDAALVVWGLFSAIAFLLFFEILRLEGAIYMSQVAYIVTVTGLIAGAIFYGERPTAWLAVAVVVIFAGVALVNSRKRRPVTS